MADGVVPKSLWQKRLQECPLGSAEAATVAIASSKIPTVRLEKLRGVPSTLREGIEKHVILPFLANHLLEGYQPPEPPQQQPRPTEEADGLNKGHYDEGRNLDTPDESLSGHKSKGPSTKSSDKSGNGLVCSRGVLLCGPPGVGKSHVAAAIVGTLADRLQQQQQQRATQAEGQRTLTDSCTSDNSVEEEEGSSSRGDQGGPVPLRYYSLSVAACTSPGVIGMASNPAAVCLALRRSGRFDRELQLPPPNVDERLEILQAIAASLPVKVRVGFERIAEETAGAVAADLHALLHSALLAALYRKQRQDADCMDSSAMMDAADAKVPALSDVCLVEEDLCVALRELRLTLEKETGHLAKGALTTEWKDVGGLYKAKRQIEDKIIFPVLFPQLYKQVGLRRPSGVLLYGPPGCGKTLLARALAKTCNAHFISVKGPELLSKFVGESEASLRRLFRKAAAFEPTVIFFDEIDALCGSRGGALNQQHAENEAEYSHWRRVQQEAQAEERGEGSEKGEKEETGEGDRAELTERPKTEGQLKKRRRVGFQPLRYGNSQNSSNKVEERLIAQMLTELDGLTARGQVFVVAATNRPDAIDAALVRPGRLEVQVYVHLPDLKDRQQIFKSGLRFSGADIDAALRSAAAALLENQREGFIEALKIQVKQHFQKQLDSGSSTFAAKAALEEVDALSAYELYALYPPTVYKWTAKQFPTVPLFLVGTKTCKYCIDGGTGPSALSPLLATGRILSPVCDLSL
ncbi:AAA family protein [Cyclospora cayetanensis]|uniref:AAA family protein n=1 Tax=Cyclospora cayetanensis TaxID=88456 RepID=A0A1D3D4I4_9EIME|nr:AAA family protein [Cyclospora cayetanensis]